MGVYKTEKKHTITLQTIADELGVSRTTVSNAFGKPDQLTPELRDKILATARNLGYCGPDPVARSLRSGRSGAYGLALTESLSYLMTDPAAVMMMQGIAEVFDEKEASLLILPARLERSRDAGKVRQAAVDGFLVFCLASEDPRIVPMLARGLPVAVIHGPRLEGAGFVGIEDKLGGRMIGEHVLGFGHERLAILTYPILEDDLSGFVSPNRLASSTIGSAANRIAGIREQVEAAGLPWNKVSIYESPINTVESGVVGAGRLLDRSERPTAILAMSDQLAIGAIQAAKVRGLRVPHDLTVVGFDDIPAAARSDPPLTTVRQSLRDAGAAAARMLLDGWQAAPPTVMLPIELIVRASSGPAPQR